MKQGFIPDSATITRREDGAWDMVALFRMDGTVTVEQWVQAAQNGVMIIPNEVWFGEPGTHPAVVNLLGDSITGFPDHYIVNGDTSSCGCAEHWDHGTTST